MDDKTKMPESLDDEFMKNSGIVSPKWSTDVPEMSDRELAWMILPHLDYEAQLIAISNMLQQHDETDARMSDQIKEANEFARKSRGLRNERAVEEWVELLHGSTYQQAAHSMAAIGMIAPLIDSWFSQAFQGIRDNYYKVDDKPPQGYARSGMTNADDFWDCHKSTKPEGIASGIVELAEAIDLTRHLPNDLPQILKALFRYRNKMFHCGFEWPPKECAKFAKGIADEGWDAWFTSATRDGVPFIFYMTEELISRSLGLVHKLLEGFGAYCRAKVLAVGIPKAEI